MFNPFKCTTNLKLLYLIYLKNPQKSADKRESKILFYKYYIYVNILAAPLFNSKLYCHIYKVSFCLHKNFSVCNFRYINLTHVLMPDFLLNGCGKIFLKINSRLITWANSSFIIFVVVHFPSCLMSSDVIVYWLPMWLYTGWLFVPQQYSH